MQLEVPKQKPEQVEKNNYQANRENSKREPAGQKRLQKKLSTGALQSERSPESKRLVKNIERPKSSIMVSNTTNHLRPKSPICCMDEL